MDAVKRFISAARLCFFLVCLPQRFAEIEADYTERRNAKERETTKEELMQEIEKKGKQRHVHVRQALGKSFLTVAASGVLGWVVGRLMVSVVGCAAASLIGGLQVTGAGILLWGTLFVRGWDIQTWGGQSLTERVNQWLYRALYFAGTTILVCAIAWSQCT
jgi:hypothetical protein